MVFSLSRKTFLWVIVTIVLGAIGSGLWDLALKPLFLWSSDFALNVGKRSMNPILLAKNENRILISGYHEQEKTTCTQATSLQKSKPSG